MKWLISHKSQLKNIINSHLQLATNTMAQDLKYIYLYLSSNAQASFTQQRTSEKIPLKKAQAKAQAT